MGKFPSELHTIKKSTPSFKSHLSTLHLYNTFGLIQPVIVMSERWKLTVKGMTGHLIHVDIADPQVSCYR